MKRFADNFSPSRAFKIMSEHEPWMRRALELARRAEGRTSPNPLVGAVIVRDGRVLGEGFHRRAGLPHAEAEALAAASESVAGATMYVTLEPCNHHGRTPPCSEAILAAGIAHVVYAIADPNPPASGGGSRLREAGVQVTVGVCAAEAEELNRFFLHAVRTGRPYIVAKYAASLDGRIAARSGDSKWITGEAARRRAHELRHMVDAVVVGADTVIADDPSLTVRLPIADPAHPLRVVLDSTGRVPLSRKLFSGELPGATLVATTESMPTAHEAALRARGVDVLRLPMDLACRVDLSALAQALAARGVRSAMVEGGGAVHGAFFDAGLVDEVWAFVAPVVIGGNGAPAPVGGRGAATMAAALRMGRMQVESHGDDVLLRVRRAVHTNFTEGQ
jgi:diaminohydroxyphosphoribosylaminopyrimidine deaminase/5-amino-6-(5-phosphoribosylamino)uracil reductase